MSALIKPNQTVLAQDLSQQNINPTRSLSWVLLELRTTGGVLIHKIHGHIFAAASNFGLTQDCFFQTRRSSEDLCENSSLYRRGWPSSAPNRTHKGLSNIELKLFSLEILHKRVNRHAERAHAVFCVQTTANLTIARTDEDTAPRRCRIPRERFRLDVHRKPLSWAAPNLSSGPGAGAWRPDVLPGLPVDLTASHSRCIRFHQLIPGLGRGGGGHRLALPVIGKYPGFGCCSWVSTRNPQLFFVRKPGLAPIPRHCPQPATKNRQGSVKRALWLDREKFPPREALTTETSFSD